MALSRQPSDLKSRVITCLNKLSDRDTLSIASSELESIAKSLSNDNFAPFLTCLSTTDSSEKSPVRRQCVRLISVLSAAHGDALSPHLGKLLSAVLRRIRDPDTAVRTACVEAVSAISSHITKPPFGAVLKPLLDCVFHEQDYNAQIGASLCLSAAVEAAPEPDTAELKKLLPRLLKLVKNDCFKAKPALLSVIGSIISVGGSSSKNALNNLVPCVAEFLTSEDWAARKAGAEALLRLAVAERCLLAEHKFTCIASLESRKFDKVKVVRDTMNRALELWKEIPELSDVGSSPQLQSKLLPRDTSRSEPSPTISKSTCESGYDTPQPKKTVAISRSPASSISSGSSSQRRGAVKTDSGKPNVGKSSKMEFTKTPECKIEGHAPPGTSSKMDHQHGTKSHNIFSSGSTENETYSKSEPKRVLFPRPSAEKLCKNNSRFTSRVVPFCEDDNLEATVATGDKNATEDYFGSQKEFEDISLIRKQLVQIENQQTNLLELLQRFIGSSKSGMNYLEKRVNGLEKALDEMSHDLGISTRRISNTDAAGNTCCMLAGAEFLSPKFWRKSEGQNSSSKSSFSYKNQSINTVQNMEIRDTNSNTARLESPRNQQQFSCNSASSPRGDIRGTLESHTNRRMYQKFSADQSCNAGAALISSMQQQTSATGRV